MNRGLHIITAALILFACVNCHAAEKDTELSVDRNTILKLNRFKQKQKFLADENIMYPGAGNEATRLALESKMNALADRLITGIEKNPYKSFVLDQFKITLNECSDLDTESRGRICMYMEELMDIFGIDSSGGMLNTWMYGFDPAK